MFNRKIPLLIILIFISSVVLSNVNSNSTYYFDLNFLTPDTTPARIQWSNLIASELDKIGINVAYNNITGWGNISKRTWSYPIGMEYDYIPTYDEGGFDIVFSVGSSGIDWNPSGLFDSSSFIPYGDNYYQYSNPSYDSKLDEYLYEFDLSSRILKVKDLQAILYEDIPSINIINERELYGFKSGLTGIDSSLLSLAMHRAEYWDDPDDHIIKYAIPTTFSEYNMFRVENYFDQLWMQSKYGSLYQRVQDSHELEMSVASSYTISPILDNKMNITVNLDPNAKFSDGDPVLPEDIKFTYQLLMSPDVGSSEYGTLFYYFQNNDSILIDPIIGNVPGGQLLFKLQNMNYFPLNLLNYGIIDKSEVEPLFVAHGYDILNDVPGTPDVGYSLVKSCGPFKLDVFDSVNSIVKLIPNPYWHGSSASLSELFFFFIAGKENAVSELLLGNVDVVDGKFYPILADFEGTSLVEGILAKDNSFQELGINMKHPYIGTGELTPLGTPDAAKYLRKAISHAIPRQVIVDDILEGIGAPGVVSMPDVCVGFDTSLDIYEYDLVLAEDYMDLVFNPVIPELDINLLYLVSIFGLAIVLFWIIQRKRKSN